ncbi:MAG TPA: hypothetical protein VF306_10045 [Pirellulales bacterium]
MNLGQESRQWNRKGIVNLTKLVPVAGGIAARLTSWPARRLGELPKKYSSQRQRGDARTHQRAEAHTSPKRERGSTGVRATPGGNVAHQIGWQEAEIPAKESTSSGQRYRLRRHRGLVDDAIAILANSVSICQPVIWHLGSRRKRIAQIRNLWFCRSLFDLGPCFPQTAFEDSEQTNEIGGFTTRLHVIGIAML